jgi:hypothetical protein
MICFKSTLLLFDPGMFLQGSEAFTIPRPLLRFTAANGVFLLLPALNHPEECGRFCSPYV